MGYVGIGLHPCLSKPDHSGRMRGILGPTNQRIGSTDEDRVTISPLQVVFFRIIGRMPRGFFGTHKNLTFVSGEKLSIFFFGEGPGSY